MKDKIIDILRKNEESYDSGVMVGNYVKVADEIMSLFEYMLSEDYEEDYKGGGV